jgi:hypothetical protein
MPTGRIGLAHFLLLPLEEQIAYVMLRGIPLPSRIDPSSQYYYLDDFYVRVRIQLDPLRITKINAQMDPYRHDATSDLAGG